MATEGSSKRRRVVAGDASSSVVENINDLPIEPLTAYVANFLALPSRAMFAVALATTPFSDDGLSTENSRKIVGDECDTLDFGHIEKDLARKLKDDDMYNILRCVDAVNTLKIFRLTNCVNINGNGLEPLRGSEMIEIIDLSMMAEHGDLLSYPPTISCELVLPILDSIIVEGSALKHLQFPRYWRRRSSNFRKFVLRLDQMLHDRGMYRCSKCNGERERNETYLSLWSDCVQIGTCTACLKHYCKSCNENDSGCNDFCRKCRRFYCSGCSLQYTCSCCCKSFCVQCVAPAHCSGSECDEVLCECCRFHCPNENCHRLYCDDCDVPNHCDVCDLNSCSECTAYLECEECYFGHCVTCVENAGINGVHLCEDCGRRQCISCRLRRPYPVDRSCSECFNIIAKPWEGR